MILNYTTYDEIRAILGVSSDDLEDATLDLQIYDNYLTMELEDVNINIPDAFSTAYTAPSPTAAQLRFLQATSMFAAFAIARQLTTSLPLFAAKQETDSKASGTRFDNAYKDTIASVQKEYGRMRNRLIQCYDAVASTETTKVTRTFFGIVKPSSDPITGS